MYSQVVKTSENKSEAFASAALSLIAAAGIQAVSVRSVAAAAGWSAGALQKTFATKDALLKAAVDLIVSRVEQRMDAVPFSADVVEYLATLVKETLPLDPVRREEAIVWNAFAAEAAHTPEILIQQDEAVLIQLADVLRSMGNAAPEETAAGIIAVSDGFALRLLYDPDRSAQLEGALTPLIRQLLA
jgi:AcrR family transcriptional regulator